MSHLIVLQRPRPRVPLDYIMLRRALARARRATFSTSSSPEAMERSYLLGNYWPDGVRGAPGLVFESGSGCTLRAADGREFLDFFAGIAVNALGHSDAGVARVLTAQSFRVQHLSNLFHSWEPLRLAEQLVRRSAHFKKVFLCNSGTEANEGALKFAKKHALAAALRGAAGLPAGARPPPFTAFGCKSSAPTACFTQGGVCGCWPQAVNNTVGLGVRNEVIAFKGGFHGRSMGSLAVTHKPAIRYQFSPFPADARFARFNNLDGARAPRPLFSPFLAPCVDRPAPPPPSPLPCFQTCTSCGRQRWAP
jgi:4-aminobutyrate aminotransferase-like enzyme